MKKTWENREDVHDTTKVFWNVCISYIPRIWISVHLVID